MRGVAPTCPCHRQHDRNPVSIELAGRDDDGRSAKSRIVTNGRAKVAKVELSAIYHTSSHVSPGSSPSVRLPLSCSTSDNAGDPAFVEPIVVATSAQKAAFSAASSDCAIAPASVVFPRLARAASRFLNSTGTLIVVDGIPKTMPLRLPIGIPRHDDVSAGTSLNPNTRADEPVGRARPP